MQFDLILTYLPTGMTMTCFCLYSQLKCMSKFHLFHNIELKLNSNYILSSPSV